MPTIPHPVTANEANPNSVFTLVSSLHDNGPHRECGEGRCEVIAVTSRRLVVTGST